MRAPHRTPAEGALVTVLARKRDRLDQGVLSTNMHLHIHSQSQVCWEAAKSL